jgi:LacI family transcriptional regulator
MAKAVARRPRQSPGAPGAGSSASPPAKRATSVAKDVARIAGVSTATVSRAFNYPEHVSPEVRARIHSVAKSLGWAPNGTARALATRRSGAIGAVFPTLTLGDFPRAIQALQHELALHKHTLLLAFSEYDLDQELGQIRMLLERGVDGLVLVGKTHHEDVPELLARYAIPTIHAFVFDPAARNVCIGPDNHKALYRLTRHLIELGHTRFGILGQSARNNDRVHARLQGVRDALAESSIAVHPKHFVEGQWGIAEGRFLLRQVLRHSPFPTALVCGNGYLAIGAMLECQRLGIRVPQDMSIVGYDDFEIMSELPVPITTVRVSGEDVGRRCAQTLIARLTGTIDEPPHECSAELLLRASSGPPRTRELPALDLGPEEQRDQDIDEARPVRIS